MASSRHLLRALRHRNYRLFFGGQIVSLIGTWITRVATSWLVYRLTKSEMLLGLVGFAGMIPTLLLSPVAGVLVDRWSRHRLLVVTQVLSLLQSLALGVLAIKGIVTVGEILALQVFQGVVNAFDTPARQVFVVEMVEDRADLANAIALNSSMFNASRIVGPSVGGLLIAAAGEGWCFIVDAVSYVAVIASLLAMRLRPVASSPGEGRLLDDLRAGFAYVSGFLPVRSLLFLVAVVSFMTMPYMTLMPVVAADLLHGGAGTQGLLMTAAGVGALAGALYLASRQTVLGLGRVIALCAASLGVGLLAFAASRRLWISLLVLPVIGAGFMVLNASINTILQTVVEERLRGRVMAYYTMAILGTAPLGSLAAGAVAARIGAPLTIAIGGAACLVAAALYQRHRPVLVQHMRPVYEELGILPLPEPASPTA